MFIHNKLVCGGAESALFSLLELLDKSKYDITVFVLHDGGEWERKFRDAGIRVIHSYSGLKEGKRLRNWFLIRRIRKARKNLGKKLISSAIGEQYDLVISYHVPAAFMFAGQELNAAKIRYIHGDATKDHVLRGNVLATAECLNRQDIIMCVSKCARHAFLKITGCMSPTCACYNPIDSYKILTGSREKTVEKLPERYICAVGRLSEEKGFSRLIRIHKKLRSEGVEHSLVIVGDGPERRILEEQIHQLKMENSVILTGYRENPYCYMSNSVFTVCSSYTEGLPVIGMESLCLGIPIVSAYPSVGELFGDECCGIITENDDASLEAGIRKMLTDSVFYERAKQGAQKRSSAFSAEAMIKQVEQIYDAVMEGKK